ncbi:ATP-binding cassette domain-containing protein [Roseovarius nitratireducens]|uniref:ATP-binding cassette domain-containing protein n=1 Tax=Roseovarius nitratireducens TaxID=2044597 RepID=UPI003F6DA391
MDTALLRQHFHRAARLDWPYNLFGLRPCSRVCAARCLSEKASIMGAVFRTQDLTKVYDTGELQIRALDGVNLELYSGELAVLLGPSGSGKSTLLNILGGLDHATSGKVWFRDLELSSLKDRDLTLYRRDHAGSFFSSTTLWPA